MHKEKQCRFGHSFMESWQLLVPTTISESTPARRTCFDRFYNSKIFRVCVRFSFAHVSVQSRLISVEKPDLWFANPSRRIRRSLVFRTYCSTYRHPWTSNRHSWTSNRLDISAQFVKHFHSYRHSWTSNRLEIFQLNLSKKHFHSYLSGKRRYDPCWVTNVFEVSRSR